MSQQESVHITRVQKKGEAYVIEGVVDGKKSSIIAHAKDVEERSHKDFESWMERALPGGVEERR